MNPIQSMKRITWKQLVGGVRRRWWGGCAVCTASVAVCLASALPADAQEPDSPGMTNDATGAEVLSQLRDLMRSANSDEADDVASTNNPPSANSVPQAMGASPSEDHTGRVNRFEDSNRFQKNDRRSRGRRNYRSGSDQSGSYGSSGGYGRDSMNSVTRTNDGSTTLEYAAFRVIVDRNIFDPNRIPRRGPNGPRTPPRIFDAVTLVGTMTYEKGTFAFFDGTSPEYKKALRLTDMIAGYKVASITPNSVKLASGTNQFELNVGSGLRREESGPWQPAGQFSSYESLSTSNSTNSTPSTSPGSDTASAGAESDVLKRLMQKREKE